MHMEYFVSLNLDFTFLYSLQLVIGMCVVISFVYMSYTR